VSTGNHVERSVGWISEMALLRGSSMHLAEDVSWCPTDRSGDGHLEESGMQKDGRARPTPTPMPLPVDFYLWSRREEATR
jgi:hypothetical protein